MAMYTEIPHSLVLKTNSNGLNEYVEQIFSQSANIKHLEEDKEELNSNDLNEYVEQILSQTNTQHSDKEELNSNDLNEFVEQILSQAVNITPSEKENQLTPSKKFYEASTTTKRYLDYRKKVNSNLIDLSNNMSTMIRDSFESIDNICEKVREYITEMDNSSKNNDMAMKTSKSCCLIFEEINSNFDQIINEDPNEQEIRVENYEEKEETIDEKGVLQESKYTQKTVEEENEESNHNEDLTQVRKDAINIDEVIKENKYTQKTIEEENNENEESNDIDLTQVTKNANDEVTQESKYSQKTENDEDLIQVSEAKEDVKEENNDDIELEQNTNDTEETKKETAETTNEDNQNSNELKKKWLEKQKNFMGVFRSSIKNVENFVTDMNKHVNNINWRIETLKDSDLWLTTRKTDDKPLKTEQKELKPEESYVGNKKILKRKKQKKKALENVKNDTYKSLMKIGEISQTLIEKIEDLATANNVESKAKIIKVKSKNSLNMEKNPDIVPDVSHSRAIPNLHEKLTIQLEANDSFLCFKRLMESTEQRLKRERQMEVDKKLNKKKHSKQGNGDVRKMFNNSLWFSKKGFKKRPINIEEEKPKQSVGNTLNVGKTQNVVKPKQNKKPTVHENKDKLASEATSKFKWKPQVFNDVPAKENFKTKVQWVHANIRSAYRPKPKYYDVLDVLKPSDLQPLKSEYPRKDHILSPEASNMFLNNLTNERKYQPMLNNLLKPVTHINANENKENQTSKTKTRTKQSRLRISTMSKKSVARKLSTYIFPSNQNLVTQSLVVMPVTVVYTNPPQVEVKKNILNSFESIDNICKKVREYSSEIDNSAKNNKDPILEASKSLDFDEIKNDENFDKKLEEESNKDLIQESKYSQETVKEEKNENDKDLMQVIDVEEKEIRVENYDKDIIQEQNVEKNNREAFENLNTISNDNEDAENKKEYGEITNEEKKLWLEKQKNFMGVFSSFIKNLENVASDISKHVNNINWKIDTLNDNDLDLSSQTTKVKSEENLVMELYPKIVPNVFRSKAIVNLHEKLMLQIEGSDSLLCFKKLMESTEKRLKKEQLELEQQKQKQAEEKKPWRVSKTRRENYNPKPKQGVKKGLKKRPGVKKSNQNVGKTKQQNKKGVPNKNIEKHINEETNKFKWKPQVFNDVPAKKNFATKAQWALANIKRAYRPKPKCCDVLDKLKPSDLRPLRSEYQKHRKYKVLLPQVDFTFLNNLTKEKKWQPMFNILLKPVAQTIATNNKEIKTKKTTKLAPKQNKQAVSSMSKKSVVRKLSPYIFPPNQNHRTQSLIVMPVNVFYTNPPKVEIKKLSNEEVHATKSMAKQKIAPKTIYSKCSPTKNSPAISQRSQKSTPKKNNTDATAEELLAMVRKFCRPKIDVKPPTQKNASVLFTDLNYKKLPPLNKLKLTRNVKKTEDKKVKMQANKPYVIKESQSQLNRKEILANKKIIVSKLDREKSKGDSIDAMASKELTNRRREFLERLKSLKMKNNNIRDNIQKAVHVIESKMVDVLSKDNNENLDAFDAMEKEITNVLSMMKSGVSISENNGKKSSNTSTDTNSLTDELYKKLQNIIDSTTNVNQTQNTLKENGDTKPKTPKKVRNISSTSASEGDMTPKKSKKKQLKQISQSIEKAHSHIEKICEEEFSVIAPTYKQRVIKKMPLEGKNQKVVIFRVQDKGDSDDNDDKETPRKKLKRRRKPDKNHDENPQKETVDLLENTEQSLKDIFEDARGVEEAIEETKPEEEIKVTDQLKSSSVEDHLEKIKDNILNEKISRGSIKDNQDDVLTKEDQNIPIPADFNTSTDSQPKSTESENDFTDETKSSGLPKRDMKFIENMIDLLQEVDNNEPSATSSQILKEEETNEKDEFVETVQEMFKKMELVYKKLEENEVDLTTTTLCLWDVTLTFFF
ncbi:unnamed protein product [Brassicogethes aeneus]|uniref:Uncharacterized protein n=1 Tax=Brassicogethes aeneus TaxID=1431903 RepID=A0A9P0FD38_BRAAE|nr:unnamed protein product [Brassicogethes aeneus]